jgi:RimJ/RimL family protein N-acetyltransferase
MCRLHRNNLAMNQSTARSTVRTLPRSFTSRSGEPVRLGLLANDAHERLVGMYLAFQPRNSFQGLPPIRDEVCVRWVRQMIDTGINLVAESHRGETVGHAAIFPVNRQKCEMLVVVCPGCQNAGIGTELVRSCVASAAELGFERIWLPVDATNVRARRVYEKCGFAYVPGRPGRELDMACELQRAAPPVATVFPAGQMSMPAVMA